MFGLIGYGMAALRSYTSGQLKSSLTTCVRAYLKLVQQEEGKEDGRVHDGTWDYLQLAGVWTAHYLQDNLLAATIAEIVAKGRSIYSGDYFPSHSGEFGHLGYPEIHFSDFFLPNLMNVRTYVSEADWASFQAVQDEVMSPKILLPYFERIEAIRKPLVDEWRSKRQKEKSTMGDDENGL